MANKKEHTSDLIGQREQRIEKVKALMKKGINPYPNRGDRTHDNQYLVDNYGGLKGQTVKVLGRIMTWREHGEIQFIDLQDRTGRIQLYIRKEELSKTDKKGQTIGIEDLELLDIGDHVEATGELTETKSGETSVLVKELRIMSKSIRPLPSKWQGLKDKDLRYRRRYLDMTMDPSVREMFVRRSKFWNAVRDFMNKEGFIEINTPVLEHTTGGADAKPFETYYDALGEHFYLRISHELPLKRLLGGGFEKVYDIGARFRNEGFSDEHLPEHIAMEWYWAYANADDGMKLTESMFKKVLKETFGTLQFEVKGMKIDLDKQWDRVDFVDLIEKRFKVNVLDDTEKKLKKAYLDNGGVDDGETNRSRLADGLWKLIRKDEAGPYFLTGIPKFLSPLSKENQKDPRKTDRFHPILAGSEMANAFAELNDPQDQLDRFLAQQDMRDSGDDEAHMLDVDFVEMLEYGMPPAVGFGLSERLFWTFEGVTAREGVPFPPMKRSFENTTKDIYADRIDLDKVEKSAKKEKGKALVTSKPQEKQDKSKKFVVVLNKDLKGWELTNTMGHIVGYLGSKVGEDITFFSHFETADEDKIPANSQYPVVALSAKPGQMYNFLTKVEKSGLNHLAYTQDMIDSGDDVELQQLIGGKRKKDLKYLGIGIFGNSDVIDGLTKKFSLWK